jgi:hypothetical protein
LLLRAAFENKGFDNCLVLDVNIKLPTTKYFSHENDQKTNDKKKKSVLATKRFSLSM